MTHGHLKILRSGMALKMVRYTCLWASFLGALFIAQATLADDCVSDALDLRGPWGQARFQVELAQTPEERAQGLMYRKTMAKNRGMLFLFETAHHVHFWMKNTFIPLDMLFISDEAVVVKIHKNAIPHDLSAIGSDADVIAVLELNSGVSERLGLSVGSQVRHPGFNQMKASWPCIPSK